MKARCSALMVLAFLTTSMAAEPEAARPAESSRPQAMAVCFCNGTILRQVELEGVVEMETPYGKLNIPVADIRRIEFGFRVPPESAARLDQAVRQLASTNFTEREAAGKELVALGRLAYPTLMRLSQAKNQDLETASHLDKLLESIRRQVPFDDLRDNQEDSIQTAKAKISGKLQTKTLKARVEHFGTLDLPIAQLREAWASTGPTMVTVEPKNETWVDTGLDVPRGSRLVIRAIGTIKFTVGDQTITTGPQGLRQLHNLIDARVPHNVPFLPGTLLGRLGDDGEEMVVGSRLDSEADRAGRLFLRIATGGATDIAYSGNYRIEIDTAPR